ncbi:hypothetical protein GA0115236_13201, partial [Streptomyces sp. IgraMP-1]
AHQLLTDARAEAQAERAAAEAALDEARQLTARTLAGQERDLAAREAEAERELDERDTVARGHEGALDDHGDAVLAEARRRHAEAEETVRRTDQEAQTQAAELLQRAQATADRVATEAERLVRDHEEQREALRARMEHIRTALAALTGRGVVGLPAAPETEDAISDAPPVLPGARREQPGDGAEPDVA